MPKINFKMAVSHSCIVIDLLLSCVEVHSCVHIALTPCPHQDICLFVFDTSFHIFVLGRIDLNINSKVKD